MKTLVILLVLVVIGIVIYNLLKKKKLPTTTLAPVEPTTSTPVTPEPIKLVYYKIFRCDTEEYLETGPIPEGSFSSGDRVEGATNVFYVVAGSSSESFGYQNVMVTKTDQMGC